MSNEPRTLAANSAQSPKAWPWALGRYRHRLCGVLAALFLAGAIAQPVDPQGMLWIMAYGYVGMCALLGALNIRNFWPSLLGALGLLAAAARLHGKAAPAAAQLWPAIALGACVGTLLVVGLSAGWRRPCASSRPRRDERPPGPFSS